MTNSPGPLLGHEPFHFSGNPVGFQVLDFWRWAASNLASNALRGLVAEFLVARALGTEGGVRTEWDAVDLRTPAGTGIEVKCSGYVQTWAQRALSTPRFDIGAKLGWDAVTNTVAAEARRPADIYVFALHHHREREGLDVTALSQWSFYVVPTKRLAAAHPQGKSLGLRAVSALAGGPVSWPELAVAIRRTEQAAPQREG